MSLQITRSACNRGRSYQSLPSLSQALDLPWTLLAPGLTHESMSSRSSKKASDNQRPKDVVLVYGQSEDGRAYDVVRQRGEEIQLGTMRPLDYGKPIHGELVRLEPREGSPGLFNVQVELDTRGSRGRPAKVSTDRYRKGWESIWAEQRSERTMN